MGKKMLTAAKCAAALGISEKQFSIYSKRDWFPRGKKIGKRIFYNDPPRAQRKAIIENVRQRKPIEAVERDRSPVDKTHAANSKVDPRGKRHSGFVGRAGKARQVKNTDDGSDACSGSNGDTDNEDNRSRKDRISEEPDVSEPPQFKDDDPSIIALESQTGSAVSISRSILNLASRDLARRFKKGNVGATQLDALNKTLARLVAVEADALKTAERMGLLMHREAVERVVGVLADRFIRAFGRLEAEIATEALLWRQMRDTPADQFRRTVREFVQKHAREIRAMEAAEIEAITKKEN